MFLIVSIACLCVKCSTLAAAADDLLSAREAPGYSTVWCIQLPKARLPKGSNQNDKNRLLVLLPPPAISNICVATRTSMWFSLLPTVFQGILIISQPHSILQ